MEIRRLRGFVGAVDSREVLHLAAPGPGIEALRVPGFAGCERGVHEDLPEVTGFEPAPGVVPVRAEGADERRNDDQPGIHHEAGHFGHPPDVLHAVGLGEAQIAVQPVADVVPVEHVGVAPLGGEALFEQVGDRGLAGSGGASGRRPPG